MGLTADRRGLVPDNDVAKLTQFGNAVRACYGKAKAANTSGVGTGGFVVGEPGGYVELRMNESSSIDRVWIREVLTNGQHAQEFEVLVQTVHGGAFASVSDGRPSGTSIGRKRILLFNTTSAVAVRLRITKAFAWPVAIHELAAFAPCKRPSA